MSETCGTFGGLTKAGQLCGRPAGWGVAEKGGKCANHRVHVNEPRSRLNGDPELPPPPAHLSAEAQEMWQQIVRVWYVGPDGLQLLRAACEQWDSYQAARRVLAAEGPVVTNPQSGAVHRHPAAAVARDALLAFRLCLKDIGLADLNFEKRL